jgi:small subunit ribosomal protein S18
MTPSRNYTPKVPKASKDLVFDYTDPKALRRFMTEQGYILARAKTGLSQKQQKRLTKAVKQARHLALLPFTQTV